MFDVHVVGAGPSGGIAAISAARSGKSVLISEEHARAGEPMHCSGLFSKSGLTALAPFFDYKPLITNPIYGAVIDFAGVKIDIKTRDPIAYVCDRAELDATIARNAEQEGVAVRYGQKVTDKYEADTVIGADGPFSRVAQNFQFPKIQEYVSTVQAYIPYKSQTPGQVEVFLSNEKFPSFFAWVIPHNEETAEFGVGVTLPHNVGNAWRSLLKLKQIEYAGKIKGAVIPISIRAKTAKKIAKRNVLLVGDAGGVTKATTGGGVMVGANCAQYAGRYSHSPARYELEWRARFGLDLFTHRTVHDYLASKNETGMRDLGLRLRAMELDKFLSNNGHMDRPTRMIKPQLIPHIARFFLPS